MSMDKTQVCNGPLLSLANFDTMRDVLDGFF